MWPIAGILDSLDRSLKLIDDTATDIVFAEFNPEFASASAYIALDGDFDVTRNGLRQNAGANEWISDEFAADSSFDASKYEVGYFNVTGNTSDLSGTPWNAGDTGNWYAITTERRWTLSDNIGPGPDVKVVTGDLRVREIANPANVVECTLIIRIQSEV